MGGVDSNNLTGEILSALNECDLPQDLEITVVVGQNFPWMSQIHEQASKMPRPTKVFVNVSNIAQLMVESDLAIGAAGATTWERCCLGLPSLVLSLAANQQGVANNLDNLGISHLLKLGSSLAKELKWQIESIMESPAILSVMTEKSRQITDGLGIERVMREFYTVSINTLEVEDE
jgi:spore coat polysaccharide biosynthesis predicted glycosyltransferase SpsG